MQLEVKTVTKKFLMGLDPSTLTTDLILAGASTVACPPMRLSPFGRELVRFLRERFAEVHSQWHSQWLQTQRKMEEVDETVLFTPDFCSYLRAFQSIFTRPVHVHALCPASEHSHVKIWTNLPQPSEHDKILLCRSLIAERVDCFQTSVLTFYVPPEGENVGFGITKSGSVYVLKTPPIDWEKFKATYNFPPNV